MTKSLYFVFHFQNGVDNDMEGEVTIRKKDKVYDVKHMYDQLKEEDFSSYGLVVSTDKKEGYYCLGKGPADEYLWIHKSKLDTRFDVIDKESWFGFFVKRTTETQTNSQYNTYTELCLKNEKDFYEIIRLCKLDEEIIEPITENVVSSDDDTLLHKGM